MANKKTKNIIKVLAGLVTGGEEGKTARTVPETIKPSTAGYSLLNGSVKSGSKLNSGVAGSRGQRMGGAKPTMQPQPQGPSAQAPTVSTPAVQPAAPSPNNSGNASS